MKHAQLAGLATAAVAALVAAPVVGAKPHANTHTPNGNANGWAHNHTASTEAGTEGTGGTGRGPKAHNVKYVFKGTYEGAGTVAVKRGNAHARKAGLTDVSVTFDLAAAKLVVDDTNGDGVKTVDDILVGDKVHVKARLPKGAPGVQPYAARKLIDQSQLHDDEAEPVEEPAPVE
jgi:hypothetical protein